MVEGGRKRGSSAARQLNPTRNGATKMDNSQAEARATRRSRFSVKAASGVIVPEQPKLGDVYITFEDFSGNYPTLEGQRYFIDCQDIEMEDVVKFIKEWSPTAPASSFTFYGFNVPAMLAGYGLSSGDCSSMLRAACIRPQKAAAPKSLANILWTTVRNWKLDPTTPLEISVSAGGYSKTLTATVGEIPKGRGRKSKS